MCLPPQVAEELKPVTHTLPLLWRNAEEVEEEDKPCVALSRLLKRKVSGEQD